MSSVFVPLVSFLIMLSLMSSFFVFFFSSRRRHTRCLSDWSSDVCSSDLDEGGVVLAEVELVVLDVIVDRAEQPLRDGSEELPVRRVEGEDVAERAAGVHREIGRASCRESVGLGGRGSSKKKKRRRTNRTE